MTTRPSFTSLKLTAPLARLTLGLVAILLAVVRIPMLSLMRRPGIEWDEITYLNFGRILAGAGPPLDLRIDPSVEHAGYGLVIAPAFLAHPPFEIAYHLVLGINLILGLAFTLLAYRIARRVAGASRAISLLSATALTVYPAFFVLPLFVFSENLVFPLILLCLLALYEIAEDAKQVAWHVAFILSVVGMWFAHAPAIIVVAAAFAGIACIVLARRLPILYACADVAVTIVGFVIVQTFHHYLWPLSWGDRTDTSLLPRIFAGISPQWLSDSIHGLFYEQVAIILPSLGIYAIALGMLIREVNLARTTTWSARALVSVFALLATLATALFSVTFLATFPGLLKMVDALFATRYAEQGVIAVLAIGVPLFFTSAVRLRPFAYAAVAAIVISAVLAWPDYNGPIFLNPSESISELAWAGFLSLLHGWPMYVLAAFSLIGLAVVLGSRRRMPSLGLLVLIGVWFAAGISEVIGQIGAAQINYDHVIGANMSKLSPYIRLMPQYSDVAVAEAGLNIATFNLLALDVPSHHFLISNWTLGKGPEQSVAVAGEAYAPAGYTEITCEQFAPIACLYVRDPVAASYLTGLLQIDAFANHPTLTLGDGLEIGVADDAVVSWQGVYAVEKTPDMTAFRWTNGDARVVLPRLTKPATKAVISIVAPNPGHIIIEIQRPGSRPLRLVDAPDITNGNGYTIPLSPYVPGTAVSIRTTNVHPASTPTARLSVEIRSFRLLPATSSI